MHAAKPVKDVNCDNPKNISQEFHALQEFQADKTLKINFCFCKMRFHENCVLWSHLSIKKIYILRGLSSQVCEIVFESFKNKYQSAKSPKVFFYHG